MRKKKKIITLETILALLTTMLIPLTVGIAIGKCLWNCVENWKIIIIIIIGIVSFICLQLQVIYTILEDE